MKIAVAGGTGVVGAHVVTELERRGHETVILSRSAGVDVVSGTGLAAALAGVDALVDATSVVTGRASESIAFFEAATKNLLAAETAAGVKHHVVISIVGAAKTNLAYYAGKKVQEELVMASDQPWSMLRTTQFHEFVHQVIGGGKLGPIQLVPIMSSQPVAAAEVAAALADLATGQPAGLVTDLAGPRAERWIDLVRHYLRATGSRRPAIEVRLPGAWWNALREGAMLPTGPVTLGKQTFAEWMREQ
jgi:uncharacterized protein YbjT (DUF2867 family)